MVYASQSAALRRDKNQFFSQFPVQGSLNEQIEEINTRVKTIDYTFLLENHGLLKTEFDEMFHLLKKQRTKDKEVFWLYCYYCACLLENYHRAYEQSAEEKRFIEFRTKIIDRLNNKIVSAQSEESFIDSLYNSLALSMSNLINAPFHIAKIRNYVAYSNICRIYWVFCRLTITQGLTVAKSLDLIEKLDSFLGLHTDVDKIIATLQAPTGVINYFSVGFFLARFLIDGGLLIKHTFFPNDLEKGAVNGCDVTQMEYLPGAATIEGYRNSYILVRKDDSTEMELYYIPKSGVAQKLSTRANKQNQLLNKSILAHLAQNKSYRLSAQDIKEYITNPTGHTPETTTTYDRFKQELYKRHCNFANDITWMIVNGLCNFNFLFGIPGPVTGYLTAVFLAFDVCMTLYKCHLAKQEYLCKKSQYVQEIADYNNPEQFKGMSDKQRLVHIEMLNKQLMELEINWQTKEATFYFVAAAAMLLMMGFTAAILVSPPALILASFFVCLVGVAMYLSTDAYAQYKEKSLYLEQAELAGVNSSIARKEYEIARNDFIFTMVKNTVMPMILITTFAICWPAALVLTALYMGYELFHAKSQHSESQELTQLSLCAP